jgi:hypothetical protein
MHVVVDVVVVVRMAGFVRVVVRVLVIVVMRVAMFM